MSWKCQVQLKKLLDEIQKLCSHDFVRLLGENKFVKTLSSSFWFGTNKYLSLLKGSELRFEVNTKKNLKKD